MTLDLFLHIIPKEELFIGGILIFFLLVHIILVNVFLLQAGYSLEDTPFASSFAGYKDWFIQTYNLPGFTIECGLGTNPLPISQFNTIYAENEGILVLGSMLAEYFSNFL